MKLIELFWTVHPWIYRFSGGRVLGSLFGMPRGQQRAGECGAVS
jgi:hypothetical protein